MNTVINFEIAKLLKEKGFERNVGYSKPYYNHLGELNGDVTEYVKAQIHDEDTSQFEIVHAPTIAEVVMWLYEKHGIWVYPFRHNFNNEFYWHIDTPHEDEFTSDMNFNSPTEAYEAAIEYTLNNLI